MPARWQWPGLSMASALRGIRAATRTRLTTSWRTALARPATTFARQNAVKSVFGQDAYRVAISVPKSMVGHLTAASGSLNLLVAVCAMQESVVPPTINLDHPDPKLDLDYVPHEARPMPVRAAYGQRVRVWWDECVIGLGVGALREAPWVPPGTASHSEQGATRRAGAPEAPLRKTPGGHMAPLITLDRIVSIEPGKGAQALRNVPATLAIFDTHFPRKPVLPGVLIIGSIGELAAALLREQTGKSWRLASLSRVSFRHFVQPGDQMEISVDLVGMPARPPPP